MRCGRGLRFGYLRWRLPAHSVRPTMRHTVLPALMSVAFLSPAWALATQDTAQYRLARQTDLQSISADLDSVKRQLAQVLRLLSQRAAQGGVAQSGPVRTSVADAPSLGRADAP